MTKSSQMKRRPRGARRISRSLNAARLPQIQVVPTTTTVARFQNNVSQVSAGLQTIITVTPQSLISAMGVMAYGAHTAYSIFSTARVTRIELWGTGFQASSGQTNASPSVAVRWYSNILNNAAPNTTDTDSSLSSAFPAHVVSRPPAGSSGAFWNNVGNTNTLFEIIFQGVENMFIDIHAQFRLDDDTGSSVSTTYTTTFVSGNVYYPALDGPSGNLNRCILPNAL